MKYGIALVIFSLATILVFYVPSGSEVSESGIEWKIEKYGASRAYQELVSFEKGRPSTEQHAAGHMFGRVLQRVEGIDGFSVCDSSLLYGCFHEFIARVIQADGFEVLPSLASACEIPSQSTACFHGIGHGLVAYLGYTPEHISKALEVCESYSEREPAQGCLGGVFMESNLRSMAENVALKFSEGNPRGICDQVQERFRRSCFFWLPQWWRDSHLGSKPLDELFRKLGGLCSKSGKSETDREGCFAGIGYIASPSVEFDALRSRELCGIASESRSEQEYCWDVASRSVIRTSS